MQLYAIKINNFLRFGDEDNTWVLDLSEEEYVSLRNGDTSMDKLYDSFKESCYKRMNEPNDMFNLIGIAGRRDDNPKKSNGSGKSSILEAICYLFYEKTVRQTANTDKVGSAGLSVVSKFGGKYPKGMRESYVECFFEENGKFYRCKRGRSFTKSQKSSSPVFELEEIFSDTTDNKHGHRSGESKLSLEEILSRDYDIFVNADMFGQNDFGKFLMGTDKTKKEMILKMVGQDKLVVNGIENIRKDKNELVKKDASIQASIDYIESDINSFADKISIEKKSDVKEVVKDLAKSLKSKKQKMIAENEKIKLDIDKLNVQISNMKNNSSILMAENIKDKGISLKKLLEDQSSNLEKLISDKNKSESLFLEQKKKLNVKIDNLKANRLELQDEIKDINLKIKELSSRNFDSELNNLNYDEEKVLKLNSEINNLDKEIALNGHEIQSLKSNYETISSKISKFNDKIGDGSEYVICPECESKVQVSHFDSKIKELELEKSSLKLEASKIKEVVKERKSKLEALKEELKVQLEIKNEFNNISKNKIDCENILSQKNSQLDYKKIDLNKIDDQELEINNDIKDLEKRNVEDNDISKEEIEAAELKVKSTRKEIDIVRSEYDNVKLEAKELYSKISELESNLVTITESLRSNDGSIGEIDSDVQKIKKLYYDFQGKTDELNDTKKALSRKIILEKIFGLQGIQTRLASAYLPALNIYVKEFLDVLSNGLVSVDFTINKSGHIDMKIDGGISDDYIMLSGGEKMIIRVAVDIGLSLLSCKTTSQSPSVIFLDEIFAPLDESHTESVFKVIELLKDKFNRVILITHQYNIYDRMDKMLIVEKESGKFGRSKIKGYL